MSEFDHKSSDLNGVMTPDNAQTGILSAQKDQGAHYADWLLILWSAFLWGGLIEKANRTLLPTYGLSLGGMKALKVAEVPLIVMALWCLFWLLVWWVADFSKPTQAKAQEGTSKRLSFSFFSFTSPRWRAVGLGTIGAFGLLFISNSGALGILLAPAAAAGFVMAHHLLSSIAPFGSGRHRVRLLLSTIVLSMMGIIYLQVLGLFAYIGVGHALLFFYTYPAKSEKSELYAPSSTLRRESNDKILYR